MPHQEAFKDSLTYFGCLCVFVTIFLDVVSGRGRMLEPPMRSSMWRFYPWNLDPRIQKNTDDGGLNCGGFWRLHGINKGKCGVCGDPYDAIRKQNEAGGRYFSGIIVRRYYHGDDYINVTIDVQSNIKGYFEFNVCPLNNANEYVTPECLDKFPMTIKGHGQRFVPNASQKHKLKLKIPVDLFCKRCVLRWKWIGGNNWGKCSDGFGGLGCGDQEEYYNCADISILSAYDRPGTNKTKVPQNFSPTPSAITKTVLTVAATTIATKETFTSDTPGNSTVYITHIVNKVSNTTDDYIIPSSQQTDPITNKGGVIIEESNRQLDARKILIVKAPRTQEKFVDNLGFGFHGRPIVQPTQDERRNVYTFQNADSVMQSTSAGGQDMANKMPTALETRRDNDMNGRYNLIPPPPVGLSVRNPWKFPHHKNHVLTAEHRNIATIPVSKAESPSTSPLPERLELARNTQRHHVTTPYYVQNSNDLQISDKPFFQRQDLMIKPDKSQVVTTMALPKSDFYELDNLMASQQPTQTQELVINNKRMPVVASNTLGKSNHEGPKEAMMLTRNINERQNPWTLLNSFITTPSTSNDWSANNMWMPFVGIEMADTIVPPNKAQSVVKKTQLSNTLHKKQFDFADMGGTNNDISSLTGIDNSKKLKGVQHFDAVIDPESFIPANRNKAVAKDFANRVSHAKEIIQNTVTSRQERMTTAAFPIQNDNPYTTKPYKNKNVYRIYTTTPKPSTVQILPNSVAVAMLPNSDAIGMLSKSAAVQMSTTSAVQTLPKSAVNSNNGDIFVKDFVLDVSVSSGTSKGRSHEEASKGLAARGGMNNFPTDRADSSFSKLSQMKVIST